MDRIPSSTAAPPGDGGSQPSESPPNARSRPWTAVDARVRARMDEEDFRRVADARREIWTAGFKGMAGGLCIGALAYQAARTFGIQKMPWLGGKHIVLFVLGGAAIGGYMGSSMRGLSISPYLSDVWEKYSGPKTEYERKQREQRAADEAHGRAATTALLQRLEARAPTARSAVGAGAPLGTAAILENRHGDSSRASGDVAYQHDLTSTRR